MTLKKEVISILVDNQYNVLSRISSLIGRRGFNIDTITASATQDPDITRITIGFTGSEQSLAQILTQMAKLEIVREIYVLDPSESVFRELLILKMKADKHNRSAIMEIVDIYRAKIIELSKESMIIELTGAPEKIDGFNAYIPEKGNDIFPDHFLNGNINDHIFPLDLEKTRDIGRNLNKGKFSVLFFFSMCQGHHSKYQQFVHQDWKSAVTVIDHRRQHWIDCFDEVGFDIFLFVRLQIFDIAQNKS